MTDFLSTSPNSSMIEQMCLGISAKDAEEWVDSSMVVADASTFGQESSALSSHPKREREVEPLLTPDDK